MTKNLRIFALLSLLLSVLFFTALNWCLYAPETRWPVILLATILYGTGFSIAGRQLGQRDDQSKVRCGLGLWYASISIFASLLVGARGYFFGGQRKRARCCIWAWATFRCFCM